MADKQLTESAWKPFAKGRELDDGALVKALARLDKTGEDEPDGRLAALDEIEAQLKKQIVAQAKAKLAKGDKNAEKAARELKDRLYEMIDAVEDARKDARAAKEAAGDDEEADSPALLTTKMLPLLRELRKGEARMHALIVTAGKNTAVLIMRRTIAPGRRKLLAEYVDAKGGAKYVVGECLYEDSALTFVVQSAAAGLARRLKQALLDQTELRLKVRVRGEDPNDVDEDGEDGGEDQAAATQGRVPDAPPAPSADALAYTQRLLRVRDRLDQALQEGHPESTKLRAVSGFASEKAAAGDFAGAAKALEMIDKLLEAARPQDSDAMADWKVRRAAAVASLKTVAAEIAGARHASSAKAIMEIQAVMKNLTAEPSSLQQVSELQNYLDSDDVVQDVCELAEDIRTPLLEVLGRLRAELEA